MYLAGAGWVGSGETATAAAERRATFCTWCRRKGHPESDCYVMFPPSSRPGCKKKAIGRKLQNKIAAKKR